MSAVFYFRRIYCPSFSLSYLPIYRFQSSVWCVSNETSLPSIYAFDSWLVLISKASPSEINNVALLQVINPKNFGCISGYQLECGFFVQSLSYGLSCIKSKVPYLEIGCILILQSNQKAGIDQQFW